MVSNRGRPASSDKSETESGRSALEAVRGGMRYAVPPYACWQPATLAEIDEAMIAAYFAQLGDRELNFDPAVGKIA